MVGGKINYDELKDWVRLNAWALEHRITQLNAANRCSIEMLILARALKTMVAKELGE